VEAELPQERVRLYDKCVTALVDTWEEVRGLTIAEKQRPFYTERRRLLERLAYELHTRSGQPGQLQTVTRAELETLLTRFLMESRRLGLADDPQTAASEAQALIRLIQRRTGLLVERAEGVFAFPHLTFQEYLAASHIEKRFLAGGVEAIWTAIQDRLFDPHWREVVLLLLGNLSRYDELPTLLVGRILEAGETDRFEPVLHRHLFLAARVLADSVAVDDALHRQIVDALLQIACDENEVAWSDGWQALGTLAGDRYTADCLLTIARDRSEVIGERLSAVEALGRLGPAETLLAILQDPTEDVLVRQRTAQVLADLGRAEGIGVLLAIVRDRSEPVEVRQRSAAALGGLGRTEATEALVAILLDRQEQVGVRLIAAAALARPGRTDDTEALLAMLWDPLEDVELRQQIAVELARQGRAEGAESLLAILRDTNVDEEIRYLAAEALGQLGRAEDAEALAGILRDRSEPLWARLFVAEALARLGWEEGTEALLEIFRVPVEIFRGPAILQDPAVTSWARLSAAEALGRLGYRDEGLVTFLLQVAGDRRSPSFTRGNVYRGLKRLVGGWAL
jgi:hypothetical protein